MKKILSLLITALLTAGLYAQDEVEFQFTDGIDGAVKRTMEQNVSRLLTAINRAESSGTDINYSGIQIEGLASQSIGMMWNSVHMRVLDDFIADHCLRVNSSSGKVINYLVRNIAVEMRPVEDGYDGSRNQEVEITLSPSGVISDFNVSIGTTQYMKLMKEGERLDDADRRLQILSWVNQFRNAYVQKDSIFMKNIFSDDALIVTGKVLKATSSDVKPPIIYNVMGRDQYLKNLCKVFRNNTYINVKFDDIEIKRHGTMPNYYGVTLKQSWHSQGHSQRYSDEGIVFLVWDFSDELKPRIQVRTWQPMDVDEGDIFTLKSFKLQKSN